ncbi:MAG: ubiquinol-cytochrome c reductase iron-sulfur subunit [Candidatus Baltobacteraceae bacterium]
MSSQAHRPGAQQPAPQAQTGHPPIKSAYDQPQTHEEITRRTFMANFTLAIGGVIGLGLAIPIVGSLVPDTGAGGAAWSPLDEKGWKDLQTATDKPVQISLNLSAKDAYLPEQTTATTVWGIKVKDPSKFQAARTDLFAPGGKDKLPYQIVTMGFVIFSPICPHLGCHYNYDAAANKFACPCHGSQFDRDGAHIAGPAARGLDPLPLKNQTGKAQVEWIRYKPTVADRIVISYTS